jgi:metallophosphoesterase superfamily enzyme
MKILALSLFLLSTAAMAAPKCNCETGEGLVFPACREKCAGLSLQQDNPEVLNFMEKIEKADSGEMSPDADYKENPADTDTTAT